MPASEFSSTCMNATKHQTPITNHQSPITKH